ncbi:unknown [Clostridium sp. CAG:780]|nr:unknown [Clostridium sp. CAG:780]
MKTDVMKNVIILKNLPSNLIDEAIVIVKDKKKIKDINYSEFIKDGGEKFSSSVNRQTSNRVIQGDMKEEDLKKLEDTKKEERKYVIKEAEIVVTNYLSKIDNKMPEKRIKRLEKSYKRAKKMSIILGIISVISIICAIAF